MRYQCINCKKTWPNDIPDNGDYSHGLCKECCQERLKNTIRIKQIEEGNFPCFGTADNYCDQAECKYRDLCLN